MCVRVLIVPSFSSFLSVCCCSSSSSSHSSDLSVLPLLLSSLLLKDYNSSLIRACCDKIIHNQLAFDGFIPLLLAIAKDGTVHTAIYALRALTLLARTFPQVIYDYGGVSIGMWHIHYSYSEDLLEAAIDMILELINNANIHYFAQASFIRRLVELLRCRVNMQVRFRPALLQKTCSLIL